MSTDNAVVKMPEQKISDLAVVITEKAIEALRNQRKQLASFVQSQLKEGKDGDYWQIPGTNKKSLLKPGAEKIANIFQLGSRIDGVEEKIDVPNDFVMFSYTIEIFHLPTGKVISQCEGSANSQEKKYQNIRAMDLVNTLQKMAQKRAYVGAVIIATGASDFFTQDMDNTDFTAKDHKITGITQATRMVKECKCGEEMMISKYNSDQWFCMKCKAKESRAR